MSEILRSILKVFLILTILFILLSDAGKYYQTRMVAFNRAKEAVQAARQVYENTENIRVAKDTADTNLNIDGGRLVSLDFVNERFTIVVAYPVKNTLFIERTNFLKSYSEVQVQYEEEKGF